MRRLVWAGLGAAVAVAVVYQVGRARSAADSVARTLTPRGLADAVTRGVTELRVAAGEVAEAMREQEARLAADLLPPPDAVAESRTHRAARTRPRAADAWDVDDEDF
ncbi:MAG TPA: hypothetical protein DHV14_05720 [Micrococcales bacterium]|uniref:Uncharacterized protein n=1 Tax=Miniimonas arenae TaxID=676201 RepID=A0A5C5BD97_9MICO|nr:MULTISPECIES: hypothetical protein [Miniimonas]TNU75874.1 hypothetical protein FH969_05485 [Miniimonas arenae]HCX84628.1 hypothetical protein [Micrococcales bacterium]